MNFPKINRLTNISFFDEHPSCETTGGNPAVAARLLITVLALILCPIKALSQGSITVTSATLTPGNEISFDWTLTSPTNTFLEGKVLYYLNSLPLNDANAAAQATVQANKPTSGNSEFMPVPGCNFITVSLLKQPTTGPAKPPIPTTLPVPGPGRPTPPQPSPVPPVPVQNPILASVTSKCIYVFAPAVSLTEPDGLITAANRKQLLSDYAPLFLYSYDHDHDEKYAPIDVVSYIQDSSLVSQVSGVQGFASGALSAASGNSALSILNPPVVQPNNAPQNVTSSSPGAISSSAAPVKLYLEPSAAGQSGDWTIVTNKLCSFAARLPKGREGCQSQNVGLYARATLLDLGNGRADNDPSIPIAALRARYGCTFVDTLLRKGCPAQAIKLEYWQFYGYSHDYDAQGSVLAPFGSLIDKYLTDHDGDWCTVQVYVDAGWWQSSAQSHRPDLAILYVSHYFHGNQAGFDMDSVEQAPTSLVVPAPNSGNHGTTYSAQQYQGPHSINSVDLPVHLDGGLWLTSQGPSTGEAPVLSDAQNLDYVQNNTLQLALDPLFSASGDRIIDPVYKHPVVYVEWGAHEFWPTSGWSIAAASKHNGLGKYSYFGDAPVDVTYLPVFSPQTGAQNLPSPLPNEDVAVVTLFAGFWGGPQKLNGPPPGPPLHCEWYWDPSWDPVTPVVLSRHPPNQTNLLQNLEDGQKAPTTPEPKELPAASDSQGTCGGEVGEKRPY